ncbi:V-type ATP synthase subunit A [Aminiphilus circumscriptus]|jgi:V/A-type H+-transporting ATPase subunit A|uniref:V-type ATP synthase subunit A n=1 Tax=Aminiphilus circumscriptus TaxID=290732 RepID=UPI0004928A19|nr:V-type ATP synthase subunit A [Aminiphilus circumscriptus]
MERRGYITSVNGPVVRGRGMRNFAMREMVRVGEGGFIGEVIRMDDDEAVIQVYEDTQGVRLGEPVTGTGESLSVSLGPGLIGQIFDGIARPLRTLLDREGLYLGRGLSIPQVDPALSWDFAPQARVGDLAFPGMLLGVIQETPLFEHRVMVPPGIEGTFSWIAKEGMCRADAVVARVKSPLGWERDIPLLQRWAVRTPRPVRSRLLPREPLVTGQRVIDGLFPLAKGGVACIPGGFGTGKTVTQHQLAKWCEAKVVVYIGCGERGNEMTDVLEEFPRLEDPRSGRPLMERTILIANTSNMPVAAREASIYTGITMAEYFRDMGYDVALMADSTSRWAEALREISGRLEEIPAEEGFPAYLPTRLAEFYERAGSVETMGGEKGSISIIGAVSPPGGDFTEPVTRHTKRFIRCFWALDKRLANARHFPAIGWLESYSEYAEDVEEWFAVHVDSRWGACREEARRLLAEEEKIQQVIRLVGEDVLPDDQKLIAFTAFLLKNGYLQQSAFGTDSYYPPENGFALLDLILHFHEKASELVQRGVPLSLFRDLEEVVQLTHLREVPLEKIGNFDEIRNKLDRQLEKVGAERVATSGGIPSWH